MSDRFQKTNVPMGIASYPLISNISNERTGWFWTSLLLFIKNNSSGGLCIPSLLLLDIRVGRRSHALWIFSGQQVVSRDAKDLGQADHHAQWRWLSALLVHAHSAGADLEKLRKCCLSHSPFLPQLCNLRSDHRHSPFAVFVTIMQEGRE